MKTMVIEMPCSKCGKELEGKFSEDIVRRSLNNLGIRDKDAVEFFSAEKVSDVMREIESSLGTMDSNQWSTRDTLLKVTGLSGFGLSRKIYSGSTLVAMDVETAEDILASLRQIVRRNDLSQTDVIYLYVAIVNGNWDALTYLSI